MKCYKDVYACKFGIMEYLLTWFKSEYYIGVAYLLSMGGGEKLVQIS